MALQKNTATGMPLIRTMLEADIPAILDVQAACYSPDMNEDAQLICDRLAASPDTAWVAETDVGVVGYLVAYRSILGKVTPLGAAFDIPVAPDSLYLHDLAISPRGKGADTGRHLLRTAWAMAQAEGLRYSSLVSVQDSLAYWRRFDYAVFEDLRADHLAHLMTYAQPAHYMLRHLADQSLKRTG